MTFEEFMAEINKTGLLPSMAIRELPDVLSEKTKKKMMKRKPEEMAQMLADAVDEVDHGSIRSVDALMLERLKK